MPCILSMPLAKIMDSQMKFVRHTDISMSLSKNWASWFNSLNQQLKEKQAQENQTLVLLLLQPLLPLLLPELRVVTPLLREKPLQLKEMPPLLKEMPPLLKEKLLLQKSQLPPKEKLPHEILEYKL